MAVNSDFPTRGILDTSIFIASETGRSLDSSQLPDQSLVTVITATELESGLHCAPDIKTRTKRLITYQSVMQLELLPVDRQATHQWAMLRAGVAKAKRRVNINDLWIAAIALANQLPVFTQDDDFDALIDIGGPEVVRL